MWRVDKLHMQQRMPWPMVTGRRRVPRSLEEFGDGQMEEIDGDIGRILGVRDIHD